MAEWTQGRKNRTNMQKRPYSRTLSSVHDSTLEDLVYPTEIVGRRTRVRVDGSKLQKVPALFLLFLFTPTLVPPCPIPPSLSLSIPPLSLPLLSLRKNRTHKHKPHGGQRGMWARVKGGKGAQSVVSWRSGVWCRFSGPRLLSS